MAGRESNISGLDTYAELWRYERALEEAALPFGSRARKNFFRRHAHRQSLPDMPIAILTPVLLTHSGKRSSCARHLE
jgi:hypothetical protein